MTDSDGQPEPRLAAEGEEPLQLTPVTGADGGRTCLLNLALLCGYHHAWVHQRDITATVTAFGVTWQT